MVPGVYVTTRLLPIKQTTASPGVVQFGSAGGAFLAAGSLQYVVISRWLSYADMPT